MLSCLVVAAIESTPFTMQHLFFTVRFFAPAWCAVPCSVPLDHFFLSLFRAPFVSGWGLVDVFRSCFDALHHQTQEMFTFWVRYRFVLIFLFFMCGGACVIRRRGLAAYTWEQYTLAVSRIFR